MEQVRNNEYPKSIRGISADTWLKAKIAATRDKKTIGEWLSEAIEEKEVKCKAKKV